jgi:hypothetical protein
MSREALLALLAVVLIAVGIFFFHFPPTPSEPNILHKVELSSALLGTGSRVALVSLSVVQGNEIISQKQLIIFSKPSKLLIAEPEGERLLALKEKLFLFLPTKGDVEELTSPSSRKQGFAGSNISYEEMGWGFPLSSAARLFVDQETRRPSKIEFYGETGELQRVVEFSEFVQFEGEWLANKASIRELLDGKSTEIAVLSRNSQPLLDLLFTPDQLKSLKLELPKR